MSEKVPITIRAEEKFRRMVASKAKADGTSVQAVVLELLGGWLTSGSVQAPSNRGDSEPEFPKTGTSEMPGSVRYGTKIKTVKELPAREQDPNWESNREAHAALDYILQNGPPGMAADIEGNLRWFAFAAKVAHDAQAGKISGAAAYDIEALLEESSRTQQADRDARRSAGEDEGREGRGKGTGT